MTTTAERITPLESDEYDPIVTVGSGNTSAVFTTDYCADPFDDVEIALNTSALDNEEITISGGATVLNFDNITLYDDSWPHATELKIDTSNFDTPAPGIESNNPRKYKEDESIKALQDYISTTYGGHYTSDNNNVQTLDLIESVGDAESFCRSNAIKYLSRYDKKGQAKRDILKALHYSLLLYHFSGQLNETPTRGYETF